MIRTFIDLSLAEGGVERLLLLRRLRIPEKADRGEEGR